MSMVEHILTIAAHYQPFATWFALLIGLSALMLNAARNRALRLGDNVVATRRYWPWILVVLAATLIAWGPLIVSYLGLMQPSENLQPISDTADAPGDAGSVSIKIDLDMPYKVFCTTDWNSSCYAKERKDRLVIL